MMMENKFSDEEIKVMQCYIQRGEGLAGDRYQYKDIQDETIMSSMVDLFEQKRKCNDTKKSNEYTWARLSKDLKLSIPLCKKYYELFECAKQNIEKEQSHNLKGSEPVDDRQDGLEAASLEQLIREHRILRRKFDKLEQALIMYARARKPIDKEVTEETRYIRYTKFIEGIKGMNSPILSAIFIAEEAKMMKELGKGNVQASLKVGRQFKVLMLTDENLSLLQSAYRPVDDFVITEELVKLKFQGASMTKFNKYLSKYKQWKELIDRNKVLYKSYVEYMERV